MHWWIIEQGYRWVMLPTEKSKIDLDKMASEVDDHLRQPIPGVSASSTFDKFEADAFGDLQSLPGQ